MQEAIAREDGVIETATTTLTALDRQLAKLEGNIERTNAEAVRLRGDANKVGSCPMEVEV